MRRRSERISEAVATGYTQDDEFWENEFFEKNTSSSDIAYSTELGPPQLDKINSDTVFGILTGPELDKLLVEEMKKRKAEDLKSKMKSTNSKLKKSSIISEKIITSSSKVTTII